ncbi:MAG: SapC family protein [Campylobacterota bacterium]|nr:SapC family protein [Campylobacterota bacterium]
MARKLRVFIENTPQHILLKGLDNLELFKDSEDYDKFLSILEELIINKSININAYVLMPAYFEFTVTPLDADSLPKFMQSLGRKYVGYYNKKYNRTGTLWEGRYKSSLIEDTVYLFEVMKYIESLPVYENVTSNAQDYKYSSIHKNLFNKKDSVVTYHQLYKKLGYTQQDRIEKYGEIFNKAIDQEIYHFIKNSLDKQHVTGSKQYIENIERLVGMTLSSKKRGRPKKETQTKDKKMYKNLTVLDKTKHSELKISPMTDLNFARNNTFLPVVANEAALVGGAFPIVFTADENPSMVALVSLGQDSLAINNEGKWITNYVPSVLRKYPFALAATKENPDQRVILIDEESAVFSKSKGKQLFKKSGEQSDTLKHAVDFLTSHETQMNVTKNVAKAIASSGILEDREISVGEGDEKQVLVNGFKVVDREKLNALSDDILADWVRKGIITLIDAHLKSLDNIQTLFTIANQRQN